MSIDAPWNDRLAEPLSREHLVQIYRDDRVLIDAVALYAGRGLGKGESVVLVATAEHLEAVRSRLVEDGFEVADLAAWGQLTMIEAAALLSRFLVDGRIDAARFRSILGAIIRTARAGSRYPRVRVYGEMVNLLWLHNHPATHRLEQLWNEAIEAHSLSLLCGYRVLDDDGGDRELPGDLRDLHSHLIPVEAGRV
jgi:DcmR-like sensory protein